jgi:hypothetical protein
MLVKGEQTALKTRPSLRAGPAPAQSAHPA